METLKRILEKLKCCWFILTSRNHYVVTLKDATKVFYYDETEKRLKLDKTNNMSLYVDIQEATLYNKENKEIGTFEDFVLSTINDFNNIKIETGEYPGKMND